MHTHANTEKISYKYTGLIYMRLLISATVFVDVVVFFAADGYIILGEPNMFTKHETDSQRHTLTHTHIAFSTNTSLHRSLFSAWCVCALFPLQLSCVHCCHSVECILAEQNFISVLLIFILRFSHLDFSVVLGCVCMSVHGFCIPLRDIEKLRQLLKTV